MKNLFKFVPVALALAAFSSCSNDDFFSSANGAKEGGLTVSVETLQSEDDETRAAVAGGWKGEFTWQAGDALSVYDGDLHKYDVYVANAAEKFSLLTYPSNLDKKAEYALFPYQFVRGASWDGPKAIWAEMQIPATITYDGDSESKLGGVVGYASNLPMWGTVSGTAGELDASLKYLTGVLVINVKNVLMNKEWILLHSDKWPLTGYFRAYLDPNDIESSVLQPAEDEALKTSHDMVIDLRSVPSQTSVIYIPVLAGVDDLRVYTSNSAYTGGTLNPAFDADGPLAYVANGGDPELMSTADEPLNAAMYYEKIGDYSTMAPFKRNVQRQLKKSFEIAANTPRKLSELLKLYANSPLLTANDTLTLELSQFLVNGVPGGDFSNTIEIPVDFPSNIRVVLPNDYNADPTDPKLIIADATDPDAYTDLNTTADPRLAGYKPYQPFERSFILDCSNVTKALDDLWIMPNRANVEVCGIKNTISNVIVDGKYLDGTDVIEGEASVQIHDGTFNSVEAWDCDYLTIGDAEGKYVHVANFHLNTETYERPIENITIEKGAIVTCPAPGLDLQDHALTQPKVLVNNLLVKGTLATPTGWNPVRTSIASLLIAGDGFINADVIAAGDTRIARETEGEATNGMLVLDGAGMELELVQGYIPTITVDVNTMLGTWQAKEASIKLDNEGQGNVAFNNLNVVAGNELSWTKSVWNGKTIDPKFTRYYDQYTVYNDGAISDDYSIFTATQLSSKKITTPGGAMTNLRNDIDLKGFDWVGCGLISSFDGNNHEIKKLTLKKDQAGNGLFASTGTTSFPVVKNLKIKDVSATYSKATNNIGVLFGDAADEVTIDNVAISNVKITGASDKALNNVGGFVGRTNGNLIVKNSSINGSIDGYQALGGVVGQTSANVTLSNSKIIVNFAQSYTNTLAMDMNYAKVGKAIGYIAANSKNVTIDDKSTFSEAKLPTSPKTYVSDTSASSGNFFEFVADQDLIGYSGVNKTILGETTRTFGTILIGYNEAKPQTGDDLKAITYVHSKTFGKDDKVDSKNQLIYHFTAK